MRPPVPHGYATLVRHYLRDLDAPVDHSVKDCAGHFGLSVYALQRRLRADGTCYRDLYFTEVRRRIRLGHKRPALGYSSPSSSGIYADWRWL